MNDFTNISSAAEGPFGAVPDGTESPDDEPRGGRIALCLGVLLVSSLAIRLIGLDQPIVENYVGRQIPTAMVARNLERGSGFLRPQLDTGPFPNVFVVEPPIYEQLVVWIKLVSRGGLTLEESGRLLSAIGMTLAAWGLFDLARRREGTGVALLSLLAFSAFPVTIRFGRSFQPDALMLGLLVLGLSRWDRIGESSRRPVWNMCGAWFLIAMGLALKITSAYFLVPLVVCVLRSRWRARLSIAVSALLPALAWYLWANHLVNSVGGSRASADNRAIWLQVLAPTALLSPQVWTLSARYFFWRCFTPPGMLLAIAGFCLRDKSGAASRFASVESCRLGRDPADLDVESCARWVETQPTPRGTSPDRLWLVWGASAAAALLALAAKVHHEYYWLALAPVLAVGVARAIARLDRRIRGAGWAVAAIFLGFCGFQARSTWETPPEWAYLEEAGRLLRAHVPPDALVVAPEALLFQGDRRGCRLETSPKGCRRAAGEWGERLALDTAIDLVEMYRVQGARYFADLGTNRGSSGRDEADRVTLHDEIRRRYKVIIVDLPAVLIAELK